MREGGLLNEEGCLEAQARAAPVARGGEENDRRISIPAVAVGRDMTDGQILRCRSLRLRACENMGVRVHFGGGVGSRTGTPESRFSLRLLVTSARVLIRVPGKATRSTGSAASPLSRLDTREGTAFDNESRGRFAGERFFTTGESGA